MSAELEAKAQNERRLGLLILENKSGAALGRGGGSFARCS